MLWPAAAIIGSAILGSHSQHRTNKRNEANNAYANQLSQQSTAKQMAFQERMSNTAHQRQMADLRASGINPMLSAKLGGASSPAGASYTGQKMQFQDTYAAGQRAAQTQAQIQQTSAQTRLTKQNVENAVQQNSNLKAAYDIARQQVKNLSEDWFIKRLTGNILNLDNNFFQKVSKMIGMDIGSQGITGAKQMSDIVLKAIAQGGNAASYVLDKFFPSAKAPNVNIRK